MSAASLLCCLTGSGPSARRPDTRGAAADASLQATRHVPCRDIIVHPKFVKTLALPPLEFCPMDWLPDEVVTNVLVHVVRGLATTTRASWTRRDGAGARPLTSLSSVKNLFSRFLALTTRVRIPRRIFSDGRRRRAFRRDEPARAPARSGRLAVARAFPPPVQVRGPAGLRAALGRGRVAWRVPAPPDDVGPNRAGRSGGRGGATRRRRRRVLALGARRGGARVPRRRVTRELVSVPNGMKVFPRV